MEAHDERKKIIAKRSQFSNGLACVGVNETQYILSCTQVDLKLARKKKEILNRRRRKKKKKVLSQCRAYKNEKLCVVKNRQKNIHNY